MSDVDDDLDLDGAPDAAAEAMRFSSENTGKGKRSAANLPIAAEDSLPWVEKYRPDTLDDVSGHQDILTTINKFVDSNRLPHLLFYGPPGTGKTSTILALARRIYGPTNVRQMVLELNASDDRGIDVVREQIKTFASTKQIFTLGPQKADSSSIASFKLIILDEADAMTAAAQMALRRIMERYTANTRFCVIANYTHKLSPALLSRCTRFRFAPLPAPDIRRLVDKVIEAEDVRIQPAAVEALVQLAQGDMRRALNVLQACHASSLPLKQPGQDAPDASQRETITTDIVYDCVAAPHPADIDTIRDLLITNNDVTSCLVELATRKAQRGLALADIVTALARALGELEVPPQTRIAWLTGLAEIEYRLAGGGHESIQTGGMIGVVRNGVDLMEHGGTGA